MMPWSSPGMKPVGELRVDDDDAGGKAPDDGHGQRAARGDPPHDRGITARDLLDGAVEGAPHERQEDEQEADRPPQLIRQIRDPAQDQQPAQRDEQLDPEPARPLPVARVGVVPCRSCGVVPAWPWGLRIIAQSTGVSVRATRPDRMMDVAIVIPNCAVEGADRPGDERHRDEDGRHHQGDGDDRARDLVHDLHGRQVGRQVLLGHLGVHRLDHHDRVVHHDADRQHHREERDQVDREAHQPQDEEGPDQRHRHREGRDQRGSQVPEEHVDHERHQDERLEQGVQHLLDRGVQELGDVVGEFVVHPGRERLLLDLLEFRLDRLDHLGGVGAGGLLEDDGRRGMPVDVRVDVEELGPQLHLGRRP